MQGAAIVSQMLCMKPSVKAIGISFAPNGIWLPTHISARYGVFFDEFNGLMGTQCACIEIQRETRRDPHAEGCRQKVSSWWNFS